MHQDRVNIGNLAWAVFLELQKSEADRTVIFNVEDEMRAIADRRLLRIVLMNLLGNAWKFTSKKGVAESSWDKSAKMASVASFRTPKKR
jgi:signal transduction histidine kinase